MKAQHGATLLAMLVVLVLGAAWFTVTAIGNPIDRTAEERMHNAAILQEAKTALIGYVAHHAAMSGENDPGALPCPEAAGNIGTANEGIAAGNCTLPAVGRLPWRTLGLDKWRDAAGEPLWYVVSPGWGKPNAATNTVINSNSTGQLTLEGAADVVGLIISPGRPLQVSASASCLARVQRRTTPSPAIDFRDYLECENATPADLTLASSGPAGSFNDQVLSVSGAEILPVIEAAVAHRFERDVAPLLRAAYSSGPWPGNPLLPFAAPFTNPDASDYRGSAAIVNGLSQGLLPFSYSTDPITGSACNAADRRCGATFVTWQASPPAPAPTITGPLIVPTSVGCSSTSTLVTCSFRATYLAGVPPAATFTLRHTADNVGMALRQFDTTVSMASVDPAGRVANGVSMNADGSALVQITGTTTQAPAGDLIADLLCGLIDPLLQLQLDCATYTISVPIGLLADHVLVRDDALQNPQHWFLRNRWHEISYYAVTAPISPSGAAPRGCTNGVDCLTANFATPAPNDNRRGLLILAGRALAGQTRPSPPNPIAVRDWLEDANCDLAGPDCSPDRAFTLRAPTLVINRTFNDRIAVVDAN